MPDAPTWLLLFGAGVLAGVIGAAGGITSLVAYPALICAGIPPLAANVTNSFALLGSGFGSALRAGPEIAGHGVTLRRRLPIFMLLSALGATLLVSTPGGVFDRIVPCFVVAGSLIVLLQPTLAARRAARPRKVTVAVSSGGIAAYNGYYGAGSGILVIALLMLTTEPDVHRANALKNVLLVASDIAPAVIFAIAGTVVWNAVWPLGVGALAGGLVGPGLARRVPASALRMLSAACGFALAVWLLVRR